MSRVYNKREEYRILLYLALNVCRKSHAWNANLLTTFSMYVIVYEQSLGFTNIINHVYGDYNMHSKRVTLRIHSTLRIGAFDTLFSVIIYSWPCA